jgi:YD repeat-containing protein
LSAHQPRSLTATGPGGSDTRARTSYITVSSGGGYTTTTRVITYTYDPLNRLTGAYYSAGGQFQYAYDDGRPWQSHGNHAAYTETTALVGTTVTTYTYNKES